MKHLLILPVAYITLFLTACSTQPAKDFDSYFYSVPVGSLLTLNREITIPPNLARRYFQYGITKQKQDINLYYPYCSITMNTLVDYERRIKPTVFEIYKVIDDEDYASRYIYYAKNFVSGDDGPVIVGYASIYYLRSEDYPDVRSLECVQWNNPAYIEYLSINDVLGSLGDYFILQIID